MPAVARGRAKHVHVTIAVIAPSHVEPSGARVKGDRRKPVGARRALDVEHDGCNSADVSRRLEGAAPISRGSKNDVIAVGPDSVQRAVGAYSSRESFHRAIIVARQPAMGIDFQGWRPGLAVVAGARQKDLR